MKADLAQLTAPYFERGKGCANLPYYITTPILMPPLESGLAFDYITVMIQTEVADRLCALPGSKTTGNHRGSELRRVRAILRFRREFPAAASRFRSSKNTTAQGKTMPTQKRRNIQNNRAAFEQRRKPSKRAFGSIFGGFKGEAYEIITLCGFRADIRGERLGTADFVRISDLIFDEIIG